MKLGEASNRICDILDDELGVRHGELADDMTTKAIIRIEEEVLKHLCKEDNLSQKQQT